MRFTGALLTCFISALHIGHFAVVSYICLKHSAHVSCPHPNRRISSFSFGSKHTQHSPPTISAHNDGTNSGCGGVENHPCCCCCNSITLNTIAIWLCNWRNHSKSSVTITRPRLRTATFDGGATLRRRRTVIFGWGAALRSIILRANCSVIFTYITCVNYTIHHSIKKHFNFQGKRFIP